MGKKVTIFHNEDFDSFKPGPYGLLVCPPGNYTNVTNVPAYCVFNFQVVFRPGVVLGEGCGFHAPITLPPYSTVGKYCNFEKTTRIGAHSVVLSLTYFHGELTRIHRGCSLTDVRLLANSTRLDPDVRLAGACLLNDSDGKTHCISCNIRESGMFDHVVTDHGEVIYIKADFVETAKSRLKYVRTGCSTSYVKMVEEGTERASLAR